MSEALPDLWHLPVFYEPFSAISHLLGALIFLVLGYYLVRRGCGEWRRVLPLSVYAASCVLLFSMSALYHMTEQGTPANQLMLRLDHGAIFVLIAGTGTPIHSLLFRGWLRWGPLLLIWIVAASGITLRTILSAQIAEGVMLTTYLLLGWLGCISGVLLWRRFGLAFVRPLLLGGVAYSVGAVMEFFSWPILLTSVIHAHEVFHIAVLMGALYHWLFVWQFASPAVSCARREDGPPG